MTEAKLADPGTLLDGRSFSVPRAELIQIGALHPNPRNARTHSKKQLRLIQKSIETFGQIKPVIADDNNTVLAGHGFVEAARLAGLTTVSVIRFSHLTEAQKRAYLIADNKIAAEAGWNREILSVELAELADLLPAANLDVSLTGFETAEIDLLLADMTSLENEPLEAIPSPPRDAVTEPGDLWLLGKHRLLCGDAQQARQFRHLMNGVSAAAVFCDPPYNLSAGLLGWRGRIRHPDFAFASGEMNRDQYRKFLKAYAFKRDSDFGRRRGSFHLH